MAQAGGAGAGEELDLQGRKVRGCTEGRGHWIWTRSPTATWSYSHWADSVFMPMWPCVLFSLPKVPSKNGIAYNHGPPASSSTTQSILSEYESMPMVLLLTVA